VDVDAGGIDPPDAAHSGEPKVANRHVEKCSPAPMRRKSDRISKVKRRVVEVGNGALQVVEVGKSPEV